MSIKDPTMSIYRALYELMSQIHQSEFPLNDSEAIELSLMIRTKDNALIAKKEIDSSGIKIEVSK